jgi:cation diffusion facilitator family transporter
MENARDIKGGLRATVVGAVANIVLAIVKFIFGMIGNSSALIADAIHSLSDLVTDLVVYFSLKISAQKPDKGHPYGHGRAETIGSAIIGAVVLFVGIGIAWKVLGIVLSGTIPRPEMIAIWAAIASIVAKEALYHYTKWEGEKIRSESIIANAWHHRSDAISSVAVVFGIAGASMGYPLMDPLAAVVVAVMIAKAGWDISTEAVQKLMDTGVSQEEIERMEGIVSQASGVIDHHALKTRMVGSDTFVDIHIQVSPRISVSEAHNIAESVRRKLREDIDHVTDALVHIDAENDLDGRHYKIDRKQVEEMIKKTVTEYDGIDLDGEIVLHFLFKSVCADVTVKLDDNRTIFDGKRIAEGLGNKILENNIITEVVIHHNLGDIFKEEKNRT